MFDIICDDCVDIMKDLHDECIDLTVTSPPYDNLRAYNGYIFDFNNVAKQLYRITKIGGIVVWIVGDATIDGSETGTSFRQALYFMSIGFNLHDTMIWNKAEFSAVGSLATRYAPVFEYMFILSKGKPKTFNPIKDRINKSAGRTIIGTNRLSDGSVKIQTGSGTKIVAELGQRHNVWELPGEKSRTISHPAPFPEQLARDHILSWSNEGDWIFDPFLGSGTTIKCALELNRSAFGCDISPEYCDMAEARIR